MRISYSLFFLGTLSLCIFFLSACGTYTTGGTRYSFDFTRMFTNMFVDEVNEQAREAAIEDAKKKQAQSKK